MKGIVRAAAVVLAVLAVPALAFAGGGKEKAPNYPTKPMEFIAPAGAGGGWDLTIRTVAKVLGDNKIVTVPMPVTNKPGGGGGVNLAYMQTKKGDDKIISVYSPPLILINLSGTTPHSYKNTTPIAGLISDYAVFLVAKDSKFATIKDVMDALKKDPKSVIVGGTSAAGSMDHIQFLIMARAAGVKDLKQIQYVAFQDNSGAAQLMGKHIDLLSTGLGDARGLIQSGDLKGLAQTGSARSQVEGLKDIPTCKEAGIDAEFTNWRGLFGVPEMPDYALAYWRKAIAEMVKTSDWAAMCKQNGWTQTYMDAPEFQKFLDKTNQEYIDVMKEIGLLKQ